MNEIKWASMVSGGGTTMREAAHAIKDGRVSGVSLELVISSTQRAGAIEKARALGLEPGQIVVINPNDFRGEDGEVDEDGYGRALLGALKGHGIGLVTQNGFLKHTPDRVLEEYDGAIFNQHPQRPDLYGGPGMYGLRPHAARLFHARVTGEKDPKAIPVAQRVAKEYDEGKVVVYEVVNIPPEVTEVEIVDFGAGALQKHVLPHEHMVQIELLSQFRSGTLREVELPEVVGTGAWEVYELAGAARQRAIDLLPNA